VYHAASYDGAVNQLIQLLLLTTATPQDPWGRWSDIDMTLHHVAAGLSIRVMMPTIPYSRGAVMAVRIDTPAVGTNLFSTLLYLEVPGELVTLDQWPRALGNFVHTRALP